MFNQKDAVYSAIINLVGEDHDNPISLSPEQKKLVVSAVIDMFEDGQVSLSHPPKQGIPKYVPGLLNNWLRKDKRLNGGSAYKAKNPGSRAGAGDAKLKNLKKMLTIVKDADRHKVEACITKRQDEIKVEKAKDIEIDKSEIPEELQHLLD